MPKQNISQSGSFAKLKRRNVMGFMGGAVAISLLGCFRQSSTSAEVSGSSAQVPTAPTVAQLPGCVVRPQQTEGPYFVDEELNRSDIRSDPTNGAVKPGVPLKLAFRVSQVSADACIPLAGAIVNVWHCDAGGVYSDVRDRSFNTMGQKFLRGSQVTNADGMAEFVTVYPGWYPGRTVHIHFKIRANTALETSYEFTSQLYFDDALTDVVQAQDPYNSRGQRNTRNQNDGIFRNGGEQLTLQLTEDGEGYAGSFDIGLELA